MTETWDAYDRDFNRIENHILIRGENIPEGLYHLVSEIIVRHTDGTYLIMQRDSSKTFGGTWELTAGGSALQGEAPRSCALRELQEETGITSGNLHEIGRFINDSYQSLYVEYLCITDCNKNTVALQPGETSAYKWVTRKDLLEMSPDILISSRAMKLMKEQNL